MQHGSYVNWCQEQISGECSVQLLCHVSWYNGLLACGGFCVSLTGCACLYIFSYLDFFEITSDTSLCLLLFFVHVIQIPSVVWDFFPKSSTEISF